MVKTNEERQKATRFLKGHKDSLYSRSPSWLDCDLVLPLLHKEVATHSKWLKIDWTDNIVWMPSCLSSSTPFTVLTFKEGTCSLDGLRDVRRDGNWGFLSDTLEECSKKLPFGKNKANRRWPAKGLRSISPGKFTIVTFPAGSRKRNIPSTYPQRRFLLAACFTCTLQRAIKHRVGGLLFFVNALV